MEDLFDDVDQQLVVMEQLDVSFLNQTTIIYVELLSIDC